MDKDDVARVAEGLRNARRLAIKEDRTGWSSFLGTFVALFGIASFAGYEASFWFALGALIATLVHLWEAGRNSQLEEKATLEFLQKAQSDAE